MASGILFEQINFTDCLIQALIIDYSIHISNIQNKLNIIITSFRFIITKLKVSISFPLFKLFKNLEYSTNRFDSLACMIVDHHYRLCLHVFLV